MIMCIIVRSDDNNTIWNIQKVRRPLYYILYKKLYTMFLVIIEIFYIMYIL